MYKKKPGLCCTNQVVPETNLTIRNLLYHLMVFYTATIQYQILGCHVRF